MNRRGQIVTEHSFLYLMIACAGASSGLLRFLESKKRFGWRTVTTSILFGMVTSVGIIGYFFDHQIALYPTRYMSLALLIGYVQPNIAAIVGYVLREKGFKEEDGK